MVKLQIVMHIRLYTLLFYIVFFSDIFLLKSKYNVENQSILSS